MQEAGFAGVGVADHDEFQQIVIMVLVHWKEVQMI